MTTINDPAMRAVWEAALANARETIRACPDESCSSALERCEQTLFEIWCAMVRELLLLNATMKGLMSAAQWDAMTPEKRVCVCSGKWYGFVSFTLKASLQNIASAFYEVRRN